ncbi:hypothetical protein RIF29_29686 [Crotalaria pallida]|uniref:Uncharacterized protein n=1 Tax=Crotalaria pallida TaxID=3830 RepID=A0AAN9EEZ8_CROPI
MLPQFQSTIDGSAITIDIKDWPLTNARGIPEGQDSEDSGFWVLEWLHMEDTFQDFSLGKINPDCVTMRTALTLIKSRANLHWTKVEGEATMLFMKYT